MTDKVTGVEPVRRERRDAQRRARERRMAEMSRALVPVAPVETPVPATAAAEVDTAAAAFAAQLMGQDGQRRGLRGGPPVLDAARATYLGAEYSGPAERRPKPGKAKDTDV